MKKIIFLYSQAVMVVIFLVMISAGCRGKTQPVTFYTLSPIQEASDLINYKFEKVISIGVGPARLPDFLNKPQIATRNGSGKINYAEFHRWGGYLDKDFLRVMSENLSVLLSTNQVLVYPWGRDRADPIFQIEFDVKQFEGKLGDMAILNVIWTIRKKGHKPLMIRRSIIQQPVSGDGNDAIVSAYSEAIGKLSREIALIIETITEQ